MRLRGQRQFTRPLDRIENVILQKQFASRARNMSSSKTLLRTDSEGYGRRCESFGFVIWSTLFEFVLLSCHGSRNVIVQIHVVPCNPLIFGVSMIRYMVDVFVM